MAFTFVEIQYSDPFTNASSYTTPVFVNPIINNDLIVVFIWWEGLASLVGSTPVTDNANNTYHLAPNSQINSTTFGQAVNGVNCSIYYTTSIAKTSLTASFTIAGGGQDPTDVGSGLFAVHYSIPSTWMLDTAGAVKGISDPTTGFNNGPTLTLTGSNELVVGSTLSAFGSRSITTGGYNVRVTTVNEIIPFIDLLTANGTQTPTCQDASGNDQMIFGAAAFKIGSAAQQAIVVAQYQTLAAAVSAGQLITGYDYFRCYAILQLRLIKAGAPVPASALGGQLTAAQNILNAATLNKGNDA